MTDQSIVPVNDVKRAVWCELEIGGAVVAIAGHHRLQWGGEAVCRLGINGGVVSAGVCVQLATTQKKIVSFKINDTALVFFVDR